MFNSIRNRLRRIFRNRRHVRYIKWASFISLVALTVWAAGGWIHLAIFTGIELFLFFYLKSFVNSIWFQIDEIDAVAGSRDGSLSQHHEIQG